MKDVNVLKIAKRWLDDYFLNIVVKCWQLTLD